LEEREKELRAAYNEIEELNERYADSRESLCVELSGLENQLRDLQSKTEFKRQELSELEGKRYDEELSIWKRLGLTPPAETRREIAPREVFITEGQLVQHEQVDFPTIILETISELGGRGDVQEILTRIESKLRTRGQLTPYMLAPDPSGQIRWKHAVHGARMQLVNQKKLSNSSPRGIWELTTRANR
jgi:predicted nuclease with TOPRIM domain